MSSSPSDRAPDAPTGTHELWRRLRRPFNVVEVVDALLGLSPNVVRQLAGTVLATSDEAEDLLDRMPTLLRSLSSSSASQMEECRGSVRGPVLWSETMARRSFSPGGQDVFVCSAPQRAYDIAENRILVSALVAVRDAGRRVDAISPLSYDDDTLRQARVNGDRASRFLEHRTLSAVPRDRPRPRDLRRTRSGTRRGRYEPALRMLELLVDPLSADDIVPFCDQRTRAQHALLVALVRGLEARGEVVEPFHALSGVFESGSLQYHHPRRRGDHTRPHGIMVGPVLVDVPERIRDRDRSRAQHALQARAGGVEALAVLEPADIDRVLDRVVAVAA